MATDKRLDQVSQLTDFDYALIVKGDQVAKASKQQLAELVGNLLYGATNASSLATVVAGKVGYNAKLVNSVGINGGESLEIEFPTLYGCILFSMSYADETSLFIVRAWNGIIDVTPFANSLKSFELTNTSKVLIIKNKTSNRIGIGYGWHNLTNI